MPLIIDSEVIDKIKELTKFAFENKILLDDMKRIADGELPPVGDNLNYSLKIPFGFRAVFSIEEHPGGFFRHLSVSVDKKNRYPSIEAVQMIASEFGFEDIRKAHIYFEKEVEAVNIIYPV
jgi:hypothetical protein